MTLTLQPVDPIDNGTSTVKDLKTNFDLLLANVLAVRDYVCSFEAIIGDLSDLDTNDQTSLVAAINEIKETNDLAIAAITAQILALGGQIRYESLTNNGNGTYTFDDDNGSTTIIDLNATALPLGTALPGMTATNVRAALNELRLQIAGIISTIPLATTSVNGLVQLATNTEVNSGTANVVVTAQQLRTEINEIDPCTAPAVNATQLSSMIADPTTMKLAVCDNDASPSVVAINGDNLSDILGVTGLSGVVDEINPCTSTPASASAVTSMTADPSEMTLVVCHNDGTPSTVGITGLQLAEILSGASGAGTAPLYYQFPPPPGFLTIGAPYDLNRNVDITINQAGVYAVSVNISVYNDEGNSTSGNNSAAYFIDADVGDILTIRAESVSSASGTGRGYWNSVEFVNGTLDIPPPGANIAAVDGYITSVVWVGSYVNQNSASTGQSGGFSNGFTQLTVTGTITRVTQQSNINI